MKWKRSKKAKEQQQLDNNSNNSGEKDKVVRSESISRSSTTFTKESQSKEANPDLSVTSEKIEKLKTERFIGSESCKLMARPLEATVIERELAADAVAINNMHDEYSMSMDEEEELEEEEEEEEEEDGK